MEIAIIGILGGLLFVFTGGAIATLGWVAKKVSDHDGNDQVLKTEVANLKESLNALENKVDQRFDHLTEKIDRVLEKV